MSNPTEPTAEDIVAALAAVEDPTSVDDFGDRYCSLCFGDGPRDQFVHTPGCPWRLAREHSA